MEKNTSRARINARIQELDAECKFQGKIIKASVRQTARALQKIRELKEEQRQLQNQAGELAQSSLNF